MQKISFGNKEYVKASQIAKRFRYTQDYVGQLCRNKKVDARLVGRTWYVEPESVAAYRKTKHSTQKSTATKVALNKPSKRHPNPKPVAPVLRSKTLKSTQQPAPTGSTSATTVSYSPDTEVSIPILGKQQSPKVLHLETTPAAAKADSTESTPPKRPARTIKVKKSGLQKRQFKTEKLPEISLSGKLKVKETTDEIEAKEQAAITSKDSQSDSAQTAQSGVRQSALESTVSTKRTAEPATQPARTPKKSAESTFAPKLVQASDKTKPRSSFLHSDRFLLVALVLGACSALAILSLASLGQVSPANNNSWSLFFDITQLKNLVF